MFILIWRGWGLLAVAAIIPPVVSGIFLGKIEPNWLSPVAVLSWLLIAGAVCVYFGTLWNRPTVEHTLYFLPLQVWGWAYLAMVAVPTALLSLLGFSTALGLELVGPSGDSPEKLLYKSLASGAISCAVVGIGYALIRSTRTNYQTPASRGVDFRDRWDALNQRSRTRGHDGPR